MSAAASYISIRDVSQVFREDRHHEVVALKSINLDIRRGEFVCLLGPSGCGKSTLLNAIAGFMPPTTGRIAVDGQAVAAPGPDRGMVFQEYALFPWMTVEKNIAFGLEIQKTPKLQIREKVSALLAKLQLTEFRDRYPRDLSGGMRQRVAIARVLALDAPILLMDEPFGALDAQTRAKMQSHLIDIWKNIDITVLFITHDLDEAIFLADRILVLKAHPGEVQELIEVPVPRPRTPAQVMSPGFRATKARLEELIHPAPLLETEEELAVKPQMIRFTNVADNVE